MDVSNVDHFDEAQWKAFVRIDWTQHILSQDEGWNLISISDKVLSSVHFIHV